MFRFDNRIHFSSSHSSIISILLLVFITMVGLVIGQFLAMLIAIPFTDISIMELETAFLPPFSDPKIKTALFIIQGVGSAIGLILTPYLFFKLWEKQPLTEFFKRDIPLAKTTILVFLIGFSMMGVLAFFIEWNQNFVFPEFMKGFEAWAQAAERQAAEITKFLTTFDSLSQFLLAFVVIAIIPAVGEELFFRGLLQNYLHLAFKNVHVAIWVSAIVFSAIHLQFYGFVPRMLLGALFGYLYYWSANLWIPILAHFFNNGFTILMVYLHQNGIVNFNIESTETPPWYTILLFGAISFILLRYFYSFFKQHYRTDGQLEERVQN